MRGLLHQSLLPATHETESRFPRALRESPAWKVSRNAGSRYRTGTLRADRESVFARPGATNTRYAREYPSVPSHLCSLQMAARRPVWFSVRQHRRHDLILALPVLRLSADESLSGIARTPA